jgi:hypothetical protein
MTKPAHSHSHSQSQSQSQSQSPQSQSQLIDFTTVSWRPKEVIDGLPALARYKSAANDIIVIDAGSYQYRAGFASKDLPACI